VAPDAREFEPNPSEWASAADSKIVAITLPRPRCLSEVGCPFAPVKLPPCSANARQAKRNSVADVTPADGIAARRPVLVEALLSSMLVMTDLGCGNGCCNKQGGKMLLLNSAADPNDYAHALYLRSDAFPRAFSCSGDDSTACCDFPRVRVLAFGQIDGPDLRNPLLCELVE
jgi:hypothetical protein